MNTPYYNSYLDSGMKDEEIPYYYRYLYGDMKDEEMYSIACGFLDQQYATLSNYKAEKWKYKPMKTCGIVISELWLKNVKSPSDINLKYLKNCIIAIQKMKREGYLKDIILALYWLKSKGLIVNKEVLCLLSFEAFLLNVNLVLSKFLELLNSPNIENYFYYFDEKCLENQTHYLQYVNIKCKDIFDAWVNFYKQYRNKSHKPARIISIEFDDSLSGFDINSLDDISFETFKAQIRYFGKHENYRYVAPITAFYLYLSQNYSPKLFEKLGYDIKLLQRTRIAQELLEGYEVINYNPYEDVPKEDKWLLSYNDIEDTNKAVNTVKSRLIDFTKVKSDIYRHWFKHYIWKNGNSIMHKLLSCYFCTEFLNYVYELKQGTVRTIFTGNSYQLKIPDEKITINEAVAYKHYVLAKKESNATQFGRIFRAKKLLNHVSDNNLAQFESGVFYNLNIKNEGAISPDAILTKDINKIAEYMKKKCEEEPENILYEIYHTILCLTQETEFRSSAIFALTTDCVKPANKDNQYVIESKTKTSGGKEIPQPITIYVKKLLDHIIKITDEYRRNCTVDDIKNRIFLIPGKKTNTYKIIQQQGFNKYLKKCCKELGLKEYNLQNLRDTYMTNADDYITRKKLSNVVRKVYTGHNDPNSDCNYLDTDIRTLLEAVHGIIIGNVDIRGKILKEVGSDIATAENSVSNQCGYCGSKSCHDLSYLDCLMCSSFITTISRIPYFKEQIAVIDRKLEAAVIQHDKEDLVNIKRLLVEYLTRLLILKEECEKNERSTN
jgi:hypothetical protein